MFEPEIQRPIKTLDLPLGGPKGIRTALQVLIDLILIATRSQKGEPKTIASVPHDADGKATIATLGKALGLVRRITGNDGGSLGLHPAVYFYRPTGRHSGPMFMGTVALLGLKLANNDQSFFPKFTKVRSKLEDALVAHKDLIATILQRIASAGRVARYTTMLGKVIESLQEAATVTDVELVKFASLEGKIFVGTSAEASKGFSDDAKSLVFIKTALTSAIRCPICNGYLDTEKSMSYDHIVRAREGGAGTALNLQLTHPYCNLSVKA